VQTLATTTGMVAVIEVTAAMVAAVVFIKLGTKPKAFNHWRR
jgi:hypothetical protein